MTNLDMHDLAAVCGGSSHRKNTQVTQALSQIQTSIKDIASSNNNSSNGSNLLLPMMLMMMNRSTSPTVVAPAPAPAPAAGPVVNISTRSRW